MTADRDPGDLLRELAPQVLGALLRRFGHFDLCEDATQEALLAAALQWPREGTPDNPRGWLITVAARRLMDAARSEQSRRRREDHVAVATPQSELLSPAADADPGQDRDDSLALLFGCCHPALSAPSQIALTLRAVGGLTTAQIAAAFLVPEATMAQRISRAKQAIKASEIPLAGPASQAERGDRLRAVLHVLYLIFNEGYTAAQGDELTRPDLSAEAIRLARWLRRLLPEDGEVAGLLALMLLTEARRPARTSPDGELVPLAEQQRGRWDRALIAEGVELITGTLAAGGPAVGAYQLQAAIAAVHDEAADVDTTDWPQILALYDLLDRVAPNPVSSLSRVVAVARVHGPAAGLGALAGLESDRRMAGYHRLLATRAHLLGLAGQHGPAAAAYRDAARRATSVPERRYLSRMAADQEAQQAG
ncbi:MAG: polymerase sigma-70 factor, subfamily [Actinomycetia bacterium]|nr:polymerase sigma-70 factor, subfamily [Actinomycetes bacterium]